MRGDVVLFESGASLFDRVIVFASKGKYVHVEIDLGNNRMIGAHNEGIVEYAGTRGRNTAAFHPPASEVDLEFALAWAEKQVGKKYGWSDIVSNGLKLIGLNFYFGEPNHWDCSDFVTRYLKVARADGPLGARADDPATVSPMDIARAYGVS